MNFVLLFYLIKAIYHFSTQSKDCKKVLFVLFFLLKTFFLTKQVSRDCEFSSSAIMKNIWSYLIR
jgi:hypothetical protein